MGLAAILGFALKLFHVLAWPLLALGYPLHASIVAIETNSNADSQKLVTYWILFSIISLVEHALGPLLVWLPFWMYMKVSFMLWLIIPHFDGALYVYKHLVRPFLSMSSQLIMDLFKKPKEISPKREGFLVEAEKYLNENGPETLEKLLSSQSRYHISEKDAIVSQKYIIAAEVKEKKEVTSVEQISEEPTVPHKNIRFVAAGQIEEEEEVQLRCDEATGARKDIKAEELKECKEMVVEEKVDKTVTNLTSQTWMKFGSVEIKEMPNVEKERANISKEAQREWTCAICQVTTDSESVLKSHLQGKKHKAAVEACLLFGSSEIKETPDGAKERANISDSKEAQREWTCAICQVTTKNESVLKSHLQGKKHKAAIEALKVKKQPFVCKAKKCDQTNIGNKQRTTEKPKDKNCLRTSQAASWCPVCDIMCSSASNFVEHCRGKKHAARIQELTSSADPVVTGWE